MVTVRDLVEAMELRVLGGEKGLGREISGGYVGDLLSCVMAGAAKGNIWVTIQGHPNIVAVATLVGMAGIIVVDGAKVDAMTMERADQEGIPLLSSSSPAFVVVAELVGLGVNNG